MRYASQITNWREAIDQVLCGDCKEILSLLPDKSVDICVTSPPYWQQRDYGYVGQIGLENALKDYIDCLVDVFDGVKRVLKSDGTVWVNLGDCFNENTGGYFNSGQNDAPSIGKNRIKTTKYQKQLPRRSLLMIPYRFAIQMIDERGWFCRNHIIWRKRVVQPTTAQNRFTIDYEPLFMFSKKQKYFFDKEKVRYLMTDNLLAEPRERRSVWDLSTEHGVGHIAPYPEELVEVPIDACCRKGGLVLDPFMGSGTTAIVAKSKGFSFFGGDRGEDICKNAEERLRSLKL
jgi:site-specific DNA-methyltransferase (adenine-specific)/site-specific DNA-methyltransferase (cytosine-N4-specific)